MNIYNDYLNKIRMAMEGIIPEFEKGHHFESVNTESGGISGPQNMKFGKSRDILPSLNSLARQLGVTPNVNLPLGLHPDFSHLKYNNRTEKHYIVSMFVDIKGSTNLFKKYDPEAISYITNTLQIAAIHTFLIFGGYVQRLQGDGVFVYFGGKNIPIKKAVSDSLKAASMFSYFVKNDLKNIFEEHEIDRIVTRIGIDLGYDEDVVWNCAGIGEASEVTTCSLHTSLASKMQAHASNNGIVVGDKIVNETNHLRELYQSVSVRRQDERYRYIFQIPEKNFRYTQHDFDWEKFLKQQEFLTVDYHGNVQLKPKLVINEHRDAAKLHPIASLNKPYMGIDDHFAS